MILCICQGLYQSMMRLRNDVSHLRSRLAAAQEFIDRTEAAGRVRVGDGHVPLVRISFLYRLRLTAQRREASSSGLLRWVLPRKHVMSARPRDDSMVIDTPRATEEEITPPRSPDQSLKERDSIW